MSRTVRTRRGPATGPRERAAGDADAAALDLAAALEQIARLVRAGSSVAAALDETARDHPDGFIGRVAAQRAAGLPLVDAIDTVVGAGGRSVADDTDRRLAGAVVSAAHTAGGPGAAAIDRAAATVRERVARRADRRAHAAQARLSARILSALPVAFTAWTATTDDRVAHFLLRTVPGLACLCVGAVLAGCGWWWMQRLVEAA